MNRCLTEGRQAFRKRLAEIEAGAECERLAPHLSRLADGEATADDMTTLRPHLRTCLSCRAALREYRRAPATAAALFPAAAFASPERPAFLDAAAAWFQKTHSIVEMASAQKVAAVAASTAALASGGTVAVKEIDRRVEEKPQAAALVEPKPEPPPAAPAPVSSPAPASATARPATRRPTPAQVRRQRERAERRREAERQRQVEASTPPPQQEFDPAFAAAAPEPTQGATATQTSAPGSAPKPTPSGGGAEEFAP